MSVSYLLFRVLLLSLHPFSPAILSPHLALSGIKILPLYTATTTGHLRKVLYALYTQHPL
jgi:hypothetical protein